MGFTCRSESSTDPLISPRSLRRNAGWLGLNSRPFDLDAIVGVGNPVVVAVKSTHEKFSGVFDALVLRPGPFR